MKRNRLIKLFIIVFMIFLVITGIIHYRRSIIDEINSKVGAIITEVINKDPNIKEKDIVEILNSNEKKVDLSKYGIRNNEPIVDLSDQNKNSNLVFAGIILVGIVLFILYELYQRKQLNSNIDMMIYDIENISKGKYDISLKNEEGNFSRLQNSLYKIATVLKQESYNSDLKKEVFKNNIEDISHQIKTPLASINLLLDNITDDDIDEELRKELIVDIKNQTDAITNLVLTLLKISTLEANARPFFRKEIFVKDLVENAIRVLKPEIESNEIKITKNYGEESFFGDFNWEKEVYINLIKNAIEHGEDEVIEVSAKKTNTYLQVEVTNKGDKISKEDQIRLFDRFYKISNSDTNFGIGLNLCKLIVEEDNGKIQAFSQNGKTTFRIKYYFPITI